MVSPSLTVTDDDVVAAELGEHRPGDVPRMGAVVVRREVLCAVGDPQPVAVDEGLDAAQVGVRRQHDDLDRVVVLVVEGERELLHERDGLEVVEVHLPVAGHERFARHRCASRTTSPGSSRPSRNSRLAPPPVEM